MTLNGKLQLKNKQELVVCRKTTARSGVGMNGLLLCYISPAKTILPS